MRKKTHDEYISDVREQNSNIDVIGTYINSHTKIMHRCKICGYIWNALPLNILKGSGCPQCANSQKSRNRAFTVDQYIDRLLCINPYVEFVGEYKNANTQAMHLCKICGCQWMAYPSNILSGKGCKRCSDKKSTNMRRKTNEDYVKQVSCINLDIIVLDEYINAKTPIKHKCKICGYEWDASPDNVLHGHGCPKCIESRGEKKIAEYLLEHEIQFKSQYSFIDCRNKKPLPFDFYIPTMNICIEYDGIQHFELVEHFGGLSRFKQRQYNDNIKTDYCLTHNINLFRIKYDQDIRYELDNIFNKANLTKEAI